VLNNCYIPSDSRFQFVPHTRCVFSRALPTSPIPDRSTSGRFADLLIGQFTVGVGVITIVRGSMALVPVVSPDWPPLFGNGPGVGTRVEKPDRNADTSILETAASMAWSSPQNESRSRTCGGGVRNVHY
jgi:hypothetical protein